MQEKTNFNGESNCKNSLATSAIWYLSNLIELPNEYAKQIERMIFDFIWSYKKHLISKEQLQLPKELGGMGVVNVRSKIKAQRIKFITRLLNSEGEGAWKSLAEYFLGKYRNLNINTHILKCKIINRKANFKSIPNIYREMLIAWTDLDLSRDTESVQQILQEPLHGNVNIPQNTKISRLIGFQLNLVQDIWDIKTKDFKPFVGLTTNGLFRRHYNQIKDNFPRQWLRTLKNEDPYDGEIDTIFLLQNDNILVDVQNATTKDLYTAILTKTNTEVLCKAKWETVFGDKVFGNIFGKPFNRG